MKLNQKVELGLQKLTSITWVREIKTVNEPAPEWDVPRGDLASTAYFVDLTSYSEIDQKDDEGNMMTMSSVIYNEASEINF